MIRCIISILKRSAIENVERTSIVIEDSDQIQEESDRSGYETAENLEIRRSSGLTING